MYYRRRLSLLFALVLAAILKILQLQGNLTYSDWYLVKAEPVCQ